ncbi:exocyst complex protein exo70 [Mytilinidion resinicola]|uniref:Exocyst complex protein EXO70 n=1 Tax=Mytilinidion resinicola TaxID=574789 RepID=A0A6A6ZAM3_9PEZI|nr:exocyst complex protein exo70 [Mytilinidion resinicola]KAF2817345.1 exocyst complex protein exo70 [Mytilinidion resinicola]
MVAPRKAALAEESAEVEVLFANMEKLKGLTKRIQGSLNRLETSGKNVQDAIGPIYGNTQKLQTTNSNIDRIIEAIDRIREPLDQRNREERIIRAGPRKVPLQDYMASLDRTTQALADLRRSNLRSNQQAVAELSTLLKTGTKQLEEIFREILQEDARTVEPLHYITKQLPFPTLAEDRLSRLRLISAHVSASFAQMSQTDVRETPTERIYAEIRGDYLTKSLSNLAAASVTTARKTTADAIYRQGTNAIGTYAQGIEGIYLAEYDNLCPIFSREEWAKVYPSTCQSSLNEFTKTLRELNTHIQKNLMTDCFLGYEIIEIVSTLSIRLETKTGELKRPIADSLKPIRETCKASLPKLLEDTRSRVQTLIALPMDGGPVSLTNDTMTKLQTMTGYLSPLSSIMTSLGDGGWSTSSASTSSTSIPTIKSFDVGADGRQLFAHYASDMLETLLSNLEIKSRTLLKGRGLQGVFLSNNVAIVDRMIRSSELQALLGSYAPKLELWRKKATATYLEPWREPSAYLLDVQYTNRSGRPHSGGATTTDSAQIVKGLSSKDKDAIKEKLKNFNTSFEELLSRHKSYKLEREVRSQLARDVQNVIEPLYGRFWDRYHEIDKGKGKYIKYDKSQLASTLAGLG